MVVDWTKVEGGESSWLWHSTVKLVLTLFDDCFEVFEYLKVVFTWWEYWMVELVVVGLV